MCYPITLFSSLLSLNSLCQSYTAKEVSWARHYLLYSTNDIPHDENACYNKQYCYIYKLGKRGIQPVKAGSLCRIKTTNCRTQFRL